MDAVKTSATPDDARVHLANGLKIQGIEDKDSTSLFMAHSALETHRWDSMYNWNWGRLKTSNLNYVTLPDFPGQRFAYYNSPLAGAVAFAWLVRNKYPRAWVALQSGNALKYVQEILAGGWSPGADPDLYLKAVSGLYLEYGGGSAAPDYTVAQQKTNWWAWGLVGAVIGLTVISKWPVKKTIHAH